MKKANKDYTASIMLLIYIIALLAAILSSGAFCSCTKAHPIESPCKSVTFYTEWCDADWKPIEKRITLYFPSVCDQEYLKSIALVAGKDSANCPSNSISWIEIK